MIKHQPKTNLLLRLKKRGQRLIGKESKLRTKVKIKTKLQDILHRKCATFDVVIF